MGSTVLPDQPTAPFQNPTVQNSESEQVLFWSEKQMTNEQNWKTDKTDQFAKFEKIAKVMKKGKERKCIF